MRLHLLFLLKVRNSTKALSPSGLHADPTHAGKPKGPEPHQGHCWAGTVCSSGGQGPARGRGPWRWTGDTGEATRLMGALHMRMRMTQAKATTTFSTLSPSFPTEHLHAVGVQLMHAEQTDKHKNPPSLDNASSNQPRPDSAACLGLTCSSVRSVHTPYLCEAPSLLILHCVGFPLRMSQCESHLPQDLLLTTLSSTMPRTLGILCVFSDF